MAVARCGVSMRVHRSIAIIATALALTMTSAHVLEMPRKLTLAPELYAAINSSLYRYFAIVGGIYTIGAILAVGSLAWRVRGQRSARWTLIAATAVAASFVSWLVLVLPVNREVAHAGSAVVDTWTALRSRWEYGHAVGFGLMLAGLCTLVVGTVAEIPRPPASR